MRRPSTPPARRRRAPPPRAEAARLAEQASQRRKAQAEAGKTLSAGLAKTRGGFMARLDGLLGSGRAIDEAVLADLEELLFTADIGVKTATALLEAVRAKVRAKVLADPAQLRRRSAPRSPGSSRSTAPPRRCPRSRPARSGRGW